jgi:hypothetical protein
MTISGSSSWLDSSNPRSPELLRLDGDACSCVWDVPKLREHFYDILIWLTSIGRHARPISKRFRRDQASHVARILVTRLRRD